MAKNIVLCFDGTRNKPETNTNVFRIFNSISGEDMRKAPIGIDISSPRSSTLKWYDTGVGTKRWNWLRGAVSGRGLDMNILEGYQFLASQYQSGDNIYLFGFSRGAYTARSLAGMVRNVGLLKPELLTREPNPEDDELLSAALKLYRKRDPGPDTPEARDFRAENSVPDVTITFVGVWDTVGALGLPLGDVTDVEPEYEFHDTSLSGIVRNGFHALSVDDTRPEFKPTLWTSDPKASQTVQQVWFAGVHSEVGGGKTRPLTDIPLRWMQEMAQQCGLNFDSTACIDRDAYLRIKVSDHFRLSWSNPYPIWARIKRHKPLIRRIGKNPSETIHPLVIEKQAFGDRSYSPPNPGLDTTPHYVDESAEWECER